ncbi:MAG: hypothetical protein FWE46_01935 [Coriobacteriia bacterium]|nr:hypothetical protein [Coriobacteriia bacterium]MCL2536976.1 hypothetical protein [Coriobacteriia bacterium]
MSQESSEKQLQTEEPLTAIEALVRSEKIARYNRYWAASFMFAVFVTLLGPERIWVLITVPLFLLFVNAYLIFLFHMQAKKEIMDQKSLSVPKFFVHGFNAFLTFCLLPLGALVFIPGAMTELGMHLVEPLTLASGLMSAALYLATLFFTALGAVLAVSAARALWLRIEEGTHKS